jgi:hypothetical protein
MWHLIKHCWLFVVHIHILIYNSCTLPLDTREQSWSGYRLGLSQGISGEIGQLCRTTVPYSFRVLDPHDLVQMLFSQRAELTLLLCILNIFRSPFCSFSEKSGKCLFEAFSKKGMKRNIKTYCFLTKLVDRVHMFVHYMDLWKWSIDQ